MMLPPSRFTVELLCSVNLLHVGQKVHFKSYLTRAPLSKTSLWSVFVLDCYKKIPNKYTEAVKRQIAKNKFRRYLYFCELRYRFFAAGSM